MSLDDSCVAEVRAKYAEDLEKMLECPLCMETMSGVHVRACKMGHHICEDCWLKLPTCPTCRVRFSPNDGRCFLIEELSSKLDEFLSVFAPEQNLPRQRIQCRMGLCSSRVWTKDMRAHMKEAHPSSLFKMLAHGAKRCATVNAEYNVNSLYHYALQDGNAGLFFLLIVIDEKGIVSVEIQVAHSHPGNRRYKYHLAVSGPGEYRKDCRGNCSLGDTKGSHVHKAHIRKYFKKTLHIKVDINNEY